MHTSIQSIHPSIYLLIHLFSYSSIHLLVEAARGKQAYHITSSDGQLDYSKGNAGSAQNAVDGMLFIAFNNSLFRL